MNKNDRKQLEKLNEKIDNLDKKLNGYYLDSKKKYAVQTCYIYIGFAISYFAIAITLTFFVINVSSLLFLGLAGYVIFFIFIFLALVELHKVRQIEKEKNKE